MRNFSIAAIAVALMLVGRPALVSAQAGVQDGTTFQDPIEDNGRTTTGTTTDTRDATFDWRWLLPLLIVPVLLLMRRDKRDTERDTERTTSRDRRFSGVKGGEARIDRENDTL